MTSQTVATLPLDEAIIDLIRERSRGRGYTDLHPEKDVPRLVKARTGIDPTGEWCRRSIRRSILADRVLAEKRPGGVLRLRIVDGERCPFCGSSIR